MLRQRSALAAILAAWLVISLGAGGIGPPGSQGLFAQEDGEAPADDDGAAEIAAARQGDEEEAAEDGDEATQDADGASGGSTNGQADDAPNLLEWSYDALGWYYTLIFLALSFTFVALMVINILSARRINMCPPHLVQGFEAHLNERRYQDAYELAKNDESFLGQVLSAGLAKLSLGYSQAIEAMQEVGEEENMKLEHRLSYMALIGTISPMVGLFGTVDGMIQSFSVIATSESTPKPSQLADGISTALVTTLVGLAIAIPAIAAYNILKNRIARMVLEVGIVSEGLMSRFQNVGGQAK